MVGSAQDGSPPVRACVAAVAGTAVGDAAGAAHEGGSGTTLRAAADAVERAVDGPVLPYTDDTQMAMLLLEHLADAGGAIEPDRYVALLAERVEPWRGYGAGMQMLVDSWRRGMGWREAATSVFPDGSFGNGAAMRAAPLGAVFAAEPERVTELARAQAEPTHAHPVGADGAVVQARAAALATQRGRFGAAELAALTEVAATDAMAGGLAEAAELLDGDNADDQAVTLAAARLGTGVAAHRSVPMALWIAARAHDPVHAVVLAVAAGGDVDTIAAMAASVTAAAAASHSPDRIPLDDRWVAAVEDGPALLAQATELARRLQTTAHGA